MTVNLSPDTFEFTTGTLKQLQAGANKIPSCGALKDNKCSIYTARPAICRLYGVAEGLECPFGCVLKTKISKQEAYSIIREIRDV